MSVVKIPVLISRYADNLFVARVVDGPSADICAPTASEAFAHVQKFLKRQARKEPYQYWPRIEEFELQYGSTKVRLFYRDGKRQFPASRELKIPIRYVVGNYVDNSVECFLVDYDIVFHCPAKRELHQLIDEAVRGAAAQIDSRELAAATPPTESELKIVRVRISERKVPTGSENAEALSIVADPVDKARRRRKAVPIKHRDEISDKVVKAIQDSCVLLVGDAGCGKTTVAKLAATKHRANALAKRSGKDQETPPLVWESSAENLIAGMQYLGEWEQRLEQVLANLESIGGILFVASQIDMVRLGGTQPTDSVAAFLLPYIQRGELRLIAETTPEELDAGRRLLPGWVECFQIVNVPTMTVDQTQDIASTMLRDAARNHRLRVEETVAETTTRLFTQFVPYQAPPKGVVQLTNDVIDLARRDSKTVDASTTTSQIPKSLNETERESGVISTSMVVQQFTKLTGLPEAMLKDTQTLTVDQVQQELQKDVIGQSAAVRAAVNVVLRLKAGLCDPNRPISTLLFCGPTGVGKTQLARSLGNYLFGQAISQEKTLVRLDMSEYASWDAVDRFTIGSDGEVASWIARLRERPMSVVLFDEFEKSSPEVHDCLLSGLDEGRITDRFGRTTTLCGAIVILTSNVGSKSTAQIGFKSDESGELRRAIEQEFRPEFLNRLDEVVIFDPLPQECIERIVEKELRSLANREAMIGKRVTLTWDESVIKKLASVGFDPLLGARPLQRTIEREVVARIAHRLLEADQGESISIDLSKFLIANSKD